MSTYTSAWLQNALVELELLQHTEYQVEVSKLLDEQAHLMGWVFNLGEDFSEPVHELIIRSTIALHRSLSEMGLFFQMVTPDILESVLNSNIEAFENLENSSPDAFTEQAVFEMASSPLALKGLYGFIDANTNEQDFPIESRSNLLLVLTSIIELFENAAQPEDPSNKTQAKT